MANNDRKQSSIFFAKLFGWFEKRQKFCIFVENF